VLGEEVGDGSTFDIVLCDALRDRAARDIIRRIHLWGDEAALLSSIISSLTATGEGVRSNSVESFILSNEDGTLVDISDFFAHYLLPKLQRLTLNNCKITSWDLLTSRTTVLTSLTLRFGHPSPTPTTSQLFSILASNPFLQKVSLSEYAIPTDGGGESHYRVSLQYLTELELVGCSRHIVGLLHQLDHPRNVDLDITLYDRTVTDIPRMVGPYLRDYFRRRDRSPNGLGLSVSKVGRLSILRIGDVDGIDLSTPVWWRITPFVVITVGLRHAPRDPLGEAFLDLVSYSPRDEVIYLHSGGEPAVMEDMSTRFPKLRALHSDLIPLFAVFPRSNLESNGGIPTSLRHIFLERTHMDHPGDWDLLTNFLACRSSSGNQLDSLTVDRSPHMCLEVQEHIRSMVQEYGVSNAGGWCPFGTCPNE